MFVVYLVEWKAYEYFNNSETKRYKKKSEIKMFFLVKYRIHSLTLNSVEVYLNCACLHFLSKMSEPFLKWFRFLKRLGMI